MVGRVLSQYGALPCALINWARVRNCGLLVAILVRVRLSSWALDILYSTCVLMVNTGISSLMSEFSVPFMRSRDNGSATWCLTLAWCSMLKSYSIRRRGFVSCLMVASAKLRIHFSAWWSVRSVNLVPSRFGRGSKIALKNAGHSR